MSSRISTILLLALAAATGCGHDERRPKVLTAVRARPVEQATPTTARRYSATVRPTTQVDVAFKVGGYVAELLTIPGADGRLRAFQDGDRVAKGQTLVTLRQADFVQRHDEAKADLAMAIAARDKAEIDWKRMASLIAKRAVSQADLDAATAQRDATRAQVDGARARLEQAETALGDSVLKAPLDGVILSRSVEVGTLATPGAAAHSIADTSTVKVVFGVPDTVVASLRLGASQRVGLEALPGVDQAGTITRISASADPRGHTFEVEVSVPNPKGELRPGMIASLEIGEGEAPTATALIPLSAIVRAPGGSRGYAVFVLDDRAAPPVARLREVELGELLGNRIPVRSGLGHGDRVVILGAGLLADGESVEVVQ